MVDKVKKERIQKKHNWLSTKYFFAVGKDITTKHPNIDMKGEDLWDLYSIFQEIGLPETTDQIN